MLKKESLPGTENKLSPDNEVKPSRQTRRSFLLQALGLIALSPSVMACKGGAERSSENKNQELNKKIEKIIRDYNPYSGKKDMRAEQLLALSPTIIKDLENMLAEPADALRNNAYQALIILGWSDKKRRQEIKPILMQGLHDHNKFLEIKNSSVLLGWGEKLAIPSLISGIDKKYEEMLVPVEPALSIPRYSKMVLSQYFEQNLGYDQAQWQVWWETNKNRIKWNDDKLNYEIQ